VPKPVGQLAHLRADRFRGGGGGGDDGLLHPGGGGQHVV
jgi:hypothetical protein